MTSYYLIRLPLFILLYVCFLPELSAQLYDEKYAAELGLAADKGGYASDAEHHLRFEDGQVRRAAYPPLRAAFLKPLPAPDLQLSCAYLKVNQPGKTKEAFEAYLRLCPDEASADDSLGESYLVMKDQAKSVEYYAQAGGQGLSSTHEQTDNAREALTEKGD
jgi:predicted Zn-dependent protease